MVKLTLRVRSDYRRKRRAGACWRCGKKCDGPRVSCAACRERQRREYQERKAT